MCGGVANALSILSLAGEEERLIIIYTRASTTELNTVGYK